MPKRKATPVEPLQAFHSYPILDNDELTLRMPPRTLARLRTLAESTGTPPELLVRAAIGRMLAAE